MYKLNGKYGEATIFSNGHDEKAISQIIEPLNQEWTKKLSIKIMPDFHAGAGCVIGTTMNIEDKIVPNLVGVDIGCLDMDTEFLTKNGWKKISEYSHDDFVLQYDKSKDSANFARPLGYIKKKCEFFYHFKNNKGLDQMLSEEHKMLVWKGYKSRGYTLEDIRAEYVANMGVRLDKGYYGIKSSFNIDSEGVDLTENKIRLAVMISADGCIRNQVGNKNRIEMHFKKSRKINRCIELLDNEMIPYDLYKGKYNDVYISFNIDKYANKDLSIFWNANRDQLSVLAEESLLWDGYSGYRSYYSSTEKQMQTLFNLLFQQQILEPAFRL